MKIYFLKRRGRNHQFNLPMITMEISEDKFYCGYLFFRKKDAEKYLRSFDGKYGNPFVVWSAELKEDKIDNRKNN